MNLWIGWYQFLKQSYNGIGPDKTRPFMKNWELQDIELLVETGHTAFSDFYSVVTDYFHKTVESQFACSFYRKVFEGISARFVLIYHFDLPVLKRMVMVGKATVSAGSGARKRTKTLQPSWSVEMMVGLNTQTPIT